MTATTMRRQAMRFMLSAVLLALTHLREIAGHAITQETHPTLVDWWTEPAHNFHFAHIDWKMCQDVPTTKTRDGKVFPGFFDPAYPDVCADRTSSRKVGFTIHAAWPNGQHLATSMLQDFSEEILEFKDGRCNKTLIYPANISDPWRPCYLTIETGSNTQMARRIGWLKGLGKDAVSFGGGQVLGDYKFVIERISEDRRIVHARFSFEIEFNEANGNEYSVYFEGCCRPSYLANNKGLVFHVRTDIYVNSDLNPKYPFSSFKFTAPSETILKFQGPGACQQQSCSNNDCYINFLVQGYHEQREWHEEVSFRKGTKWEMGAYKCMLEGSNPLQFDAIKCPDGHSEEAFENSNWKLFAPNARLSSTNEENAAGVVRFDVQEEGVYNMVIVAEMCLERDSCTKKLAQVLDTKVIIKQMENNDQPVVYVPRLDDGKVMSSETPVNILSGGSQSYPVYSTPIEIQCGFPYFFQHHVGAQRPDGKPRDELNALNNSFGTKLEFAFKDPDFQRSPCPGAPSESVDQTIEFISSASMLPRGMDISATLSSLSVEGKNIGVAKVNIQWTPICEDRSQVGLFQICFFAKDQHGSATGFTSYSVPSPRNLGGVASWLPPGSSDEALQYAPTCIFVDSKQPAQNPPPVLSTFDLATQRTRIPPVCCGNTMPRSGWEPDAQGSKFPNCTNEIGNQYVLGCVESEVQECQSYELVVSAESENDFSWTDIRFSYPDAQASEKENFQVSPPKYGCNEINFDTCVSNPKLKRKMARKLTVKMGPQQPSQMRICYQGFQIAPANVDQKAWIQLYGSSQSLQTPTSESCVTCFMLNVISTPVWVKEEFVDQNGRRVKLLRSTSGLHSEVQKVSVGKKTLIKLVALVLNTNSTADASISILADPGAPEGSKLLEKVSGVGGAYSRTFEYTPSLEHAGLTVHVLFTASIKRANGDSVDSEVLRLKFLVMKEHLGWVATPCPFNMINDRCRAQGINDKTAVVGCKTESVIEVKGSPKGYYDFKLRIQKYPECRNDEKTGNCFYPEDNYIGVKVCDETLINDCCGDGVCNGAESGYGCPEDCKPDEASLEPVEGNPSKAKFTFTPQRHQQGQDVLVCIEAYTEFAGTTVIQQTRGPFLAPSLCIVFQVASCRYCVPPGETLQSIASSYILIDWLLLYNTNPDVGNPDRIISQRQIQVGPLYEVESGDTIMSVAATMKTTVKMLMTNNPQIAENGMMKPKQKICVLPCSAA